MKLLRNYQQDAIRSLFKFWCDYPNGTPLIVAPTGSGKTILIAEIVRRIIEKKPDFKIFVLTHRKELISQNAKTIYEHTYCPVGTYSASLGIKTIRKITVAQIQSIYKKDVEADVVIVDEAHLISGDADSMYGKFLSAAHARNIRLKVIGLTATPYRMDKGSLVGEGALFSDIAHEIRISALIADGFLSPVISKPSKEDIDLSAVNMSGYDYNQKDLSDAVDVKDLVSKHVSEIVHWSSDRKHVLVFAVGVSHAKHLAEEFLRQNVPAGYVTGEMSHIDREMKLNAFKAGAIRVLVNCEILTTGFDFPAVDCLAIIRPTKSTGLYVQMVGRGMRIADGKRNCLVLDFGGNIDRHGPVDCIEIRRKKGDRKVATVCTPVKECQSCGALIAVRFATCPLCGAALPLARKALTAEPSDAPIIKPTAPVSKIVTSINYRIHTKAERRMLRIDYALGHDSVSEFLCFEHGGYATEMARRKWIAFGGAQPVPSMSEDAFTRAMSGELKMPNEVEVVKEGKYSRIKKIISFVETPNASGISEEAQYLMDIGL